MNAEQGKPHETESGFQIDQVSQPLQGPLIAVGDSPSPFMVRVAVTPEGTLGKTR